MSSRRPCFCSCIVIAETYNPRPLPHRPPNPAVLESWIFQIWRAYFAFEVVFDDRRALDSIVQQEKKFLVAQMPHGIVVRAHLTSQKNGLDSARPYSLRVLLVPDRQGPFPDTFGVPFLGGQAVRMGWNTLLRSTAQSKS